MFLYTTDMILGKTYQPIGLVEGSTVQTKNFVKDFGAGLKNFVGGELKAYTEMLAMARREATMRMIAQAESLGADAIVGVRYSSSSIMQGAAECVAYGTAVKINN